MFTVGVRTRPVVDFSRLLQRQLAAIDQFRQVLHRAERAADSCGGSREQRMDASRHLDVVRRTEQALLDRADVRLREAGGGPVLEVGWTALIAHRQDWFSHKMGEGLTAAGVEVLGRTTIGPEVVGWAIVEQPDLVVVDETLAMLTGEQTVRELRRYCPQAVITGIVRDSEQVARMLDAGATTVRVRATPPAVLVDLLAGLARAPALDRARGSTGAGRVGASHRGAAVPVA